MEKAKYQVKSFDRNSRSPDGSKIYTDNCGHAHRSIRTASNCEQKLIGGGLPRGSWRPKWVNSDIVNLTTSEVTEADYIDQY